MHRLLNKRIEIPLLTAIIVVASLATGAAGLLQGQGKSGFEMVCGEVAWLFGPLFCAFLWALLAGDIFWRRGGHPWALSIGSLFGFGTFYVWIYLGCHR